MKRLLLITLLAASFAGNAFADGGRLRFSKNAGPFLVTLFTTPEPLTPGPADFSVMVQEASTGKMLTDADVQLVLTGPGGGPVVEAHATSGVATNRLMQAADVTLPVAGKWNISIQVKEGAQTASCDTDLKVEAGSRKSVFVWIFSLLPVLAGALFAMNQRQKDRTRSTPGSDA